MTTPQLPPPARVRTPKDRADKVDAVLTVLREHNGLTVSELATATGFSRPTITAILDEMRALGIACDTDTNGHTIGRPAGSWTISPTAGIVVGLDLLDRSLLAVAATIQGTVLRTRTAPLPTDDADSRLNTVTAVVHSMSADLSAHGALRHLSVSATGRIDDAGTILLSDLVPVWNGLPLAERLSDALGVPVTVENDINMAALGEFSTRRQAGVIGDDGDLLFIQLARGLHTGLVLGGSIHRGHEWNAGEISDLLDLRLADHTSITDDWIRRASLTIASVCAVVDPHAIVLSAPSPTTVPVMTRVADAMRSLRQQSTPRLASTVSDLGWSASVVGALYDALQSADSHLTGTRRPRPVCLQGLSTIHQHLQKGHHTTMTRPVSSLPSDTLRVGVVGVGARARFALAAELPDNNGRITAVCDPHPFTAERVRSRLNRDPDTVAITSTMEDFIASGIDVAFVTSPDDTHARVTCALLEAGIPVYLEKPLAIDLEDATAILTTAYHTGTKLYVGHNMRHMNVVRSMRDLIRSGRIGEVKGIWCRHFVGHGGDYYFKDWHAERAHVGSLLLQKAAHDIDVMHWLADSHTTDVVAMGGLTLYDRVTNRSDNSTQLMGDWFSTDNWPPLSQTGLHPIIDVEDLSMMLMRMESGVFASYQQCHYTPDYWRNYTVIGTEGRMENFGDSEGGVIRLWNHRSDYDPTGDDTIPILGDAGGHSDADVLTITEFIRFVRHNTPTDTSPLGAWYAVAAGIQATTSLRNGAQPQHIPTLPSDLVAYFNNNQQRNA